MPFKAAKVVILGGSGFSTLVRAQGLEDFICSIYATGLSQVYKFLPPPRWLTVKLETTKSADKINSNSQSNHIAIK